MKSWQELLQLVAARRARLENVMRLQKVFQEMINAVDWMDDIKVRFDLVVCVSVSLVTPLFHCKCEIYFCYETLFAGKLAIGRLWSSFT